MLGGSYTHTIGEGSLMRGNNLLFGFIRNDNILEEQASTRRGLKLYDERGHFIKGIYLQEISPKTSSKGAGGQ